LHAQADAIEALASDEPTSSAPTWVDFIGATARTACDETTIRKAVASGEVESRRRGRRRVISVASLDAWIASAPSDRKRGGSPPRKASKSIANDIDETERDRRELAQAGVALRGVKRRAGT